MSGMYGAQDYHMCDVCDGMTRCSCVSGLEIFGKESLANKLFWKCSGCDNHVSTGVDGYPLGPITDRAGRAKRYNDAINGAVEELTCGIQKNISEFWKARFNYFPVPDCGFLEPSDTVIDTVLQRVKVSFGDTLSDISLRGGAVYVEFN